MNTHSLDLQHPALLSDAMPMVEKNLYRRGLKFVGVDRRVLKDIVFLQHGALNFVD